MLAYTLVDPLVTTADQSELTSHCKLLRQTVIEPPSLWGEQRHQARFELARTNAGGDMIEGAVERLRFVDHSGTATERLVVDLAMRWVSEVAQVVAWIENRASIVGLADDPSSERAREHFRENRNDVEPMAHLSPDASGHWPRAGRRAAERRYVEQRDRC